VGRNENLQVAFLKSQITDQVTTRLLFSETLTLPRKIKLSTFNRYFSTDVAENEEEWGFPGIDKMLVKDAISSLGVTDFSVGEYSEL
jgi:hypothetical protein